MIPPAIRALIETPPPIMPLMFGRDIRTGKKVFETLEDTTVDERWAFRDKEQDERNKRRAASWAIRFRVSL